LSGFTDPQAERPESGAVESCASTEADQGLTPRCGPIGAFEAKRLFSQAPAPNWRTKLAIAMAAVLVWIACLVVAIAKGWVDWPVP
jgi:hypothetical protein